MPRVGPAGSGSPSGVGRTSSRSASVVPDSQDSISRRLSAVSGLPPVAVPPPAAAPLADAAGGGGLGVRHELAGDVAGRAGGQRHRRAGYGDVFPVSTADRVVGVYVIVGGIVTLTLLFTGWSYAAVWGGPPGVTARWAQADDQRRPGRPPGGGRGRAPSFWCRSDAL